MMEVLQLEFMQRALIAGLLVSVACGVIGTYVVVNRFVFISGAIAHAAYGGNSRAFASKTFRKKVEAAYRKLEAEAEAFQAIEASSAQ